MSELADQRLDRLSAGYRANDYSDAFAGAREILSELDVPIAEDDRRFTIVAREILKGKGQLASAQVNWADGREDYTPSWSPDLPETLFPKPVAVADAVSTCERSSAFYGRC